MLLIVAEPVIEVGTELNVAARLAWFVQFQIKLPILAGAEGVVAVIPVTLTVDAAL